MTQLANEAPSAVWLSAMLQWKEKVKGNVIVRGATLSMAAECQMPAIPFSGDVVAHRGSRFVSAIPFQCRYRLFSGSIAV